MADRKLVGPRGIIKKLHDNGDGTYAEVVSSSFAINDSTGTESKTLRSTPTEPYSMPVSIRESVEDTDLSYDRSNIRLLSSDGREGNGTTVIFITTLGYEWIRLQITGNWVGTIAFQTSMDGWSWATTGMNDTGQLGSFPLSQVLSNRIVYGPVTATYFRAVFTAYTSGSATASASLDMRSPGSITVGGAMGISNSPYVSLNSGTMSYTNQSVATAPRGVAPTIAAVSANGADLLASTDLVNYASATITVSGTFVGTLSVQFSDDNAGFTTCPCVYPIAGGTTNTITAAGQYVIKGFFGRYMRIRSTEWTSGTANASMTCHTKDNSVVNQQGARQHGAWSTNISATAGQNTTTVTTNSTTISSANTNRRGLIICNTGTVPVSINLTGATATAGMLTLPVGSPPLSILSHVPLTAITAIVASSTCDVSVTELF
jgi:hypothetical protein